MKRRPVIQPGRGSEAFDDVHDSFTEEEPLIGSAASRKKAARSRYVAALVCVAVAVATWVGMAELLQALESKSSSKYNHYYFMTYFIHSGYAVCVPVGLLIRWLQRRSHPDIVHGSWWGHRGFKRLCLNSLILAPLSFAAAYAWYRSLTGTTVGVNTGIYNVCCVFVFILSVFLLKEKISLIKVAAIAVCVGGVVLVALKGTSAPHKHVGSSSGSDDDPKNTPIGIIMVIASTGLFALYEVVVGKVSGGHGGGGEIADQFLLVGGIGVANFLTLWPGVPILHLAGWERFAWPDGTNLVTLVVNSCLDTALNSALVAGIWLSSPLFIAVGTLLTIPTSLVTDRIVHDIEMPLAGLMGVMLIVLGFLGMNFGQYWMKRQERKAALLEEEAEGTQESDSDSECSDQGDVECQRATGTTTPKGSVNYCAGHPHEEGNA